VKRRGTSNSNQRGSSASRRIRRQWLVDTFGDGEKVQCSHCPAMLTCDTVTADRIIPGCEGGTYRRGNIRPSCMDCASKQGGKLSWSRRSSR
jgi:hypothetical protein